MLLLVIKIMLIFPKLDIDDIEWFIFTMSNYVIFESIRMSKFLLQIWHL